MISSVLDIFILIFGVLFFIVWALLYLFFITYPIWTDNRTFINFVGYIERPLEKAIKSIKKVKRC